MSYSNTHFVKPNEPGSQARVKLENCQIVNVIDGRYYDVGTSIILQAGKIVSMPGPSSIPSDVIPDFVIDLQGKTVLPGLYNTHCHLIQFEPTMIVSLSDMRRIKRYRERQVLKNLSECLAHGITHIRDAWHPDLRENRVLKERISKGDIPGPRILQSVVVGPTGSYMQEKLSLIMKVSGMPHVENAAKDYAGAVAFPIDATEGQVRDAVDIAIDQRGADVIKIGDETFSFLARKQVPLMTIEQLCVVADQARRRGVQSTMHHSSVDSLQRGIKAGVSSIAHIPWDSPLNEENMEAFKTSGCINDPTVSAFYGMLSWKVTGDRLNEHPELIRLTEFRNQIYTFENIADEYFAPELRSVVMNGYKRCFSGKPKMLGIMDMSAMMAWADRIATYFENFCLLYEHGIPMSTANDNKPPCTPAMIMLELLMFDHLLKSKPNGKQLSGAEAVKMATINSASSLGLDKEFGTIDIGKTADLVILEGDPLEDFRIIGTQAAALFMDGKLVINNCGLEIRSNDQ